MSVSISNIYAQKMYLTAWMLRNQNVKLRNAMLLVRLEPIL